MIPRDERGGAIILALLVSMVVLGVGAVALSVARAELRVSANHARATSAKYFAEGELHRVVGLQNDLTRSPRYLFDPASYTHRATGPGDTSRLQLQGAVAPSSAGANTVGGVQLLVPDKDPVIDPPPYRVRSVSTLSDGSSATYEAVVDVVSLLDFAVFSDVDIFIAPNITISGRVYSGDDITLTGATATFLQRVEYADQLFNSGNGVFQQGHQRVPPLPSIPALVNLAFYENATKAAGVCSSGIGLYIGTGGGVATAQSQALFRAHENGIPANWDGWDDAGCRYGMPCWAIDLSLFDFSASPVTYAGTPLVDWNGSPLTNFNGVIWVEGEAHVWGHLGGRSPEENRITDGRDYLTPPMIAANEYSNGVLDPGEDGNNGGAANGSLDPANRGASLGIYSNDPIFIDHNIFVGTDSIGNPVRMALVSAGDISIDGYAPKLVRVESAVLSVGESWRPQGDPGSGHGDHQPNDWANVNGDQPPDSYVYDVDMDGTIETNNGLPHSYDRDETDMRQAWAIQNLGNLVVNESPHSGHWAAHGHPRFYTYDTQLVTSEIPCYPTLPDYGLVPGSFAEVLNVP